MKNPLWIKFRDIRRDHVFLLKAKRKIWKKEKAFHPTKCFFLLDAPAHWNAKDAKRLAAFPGVRIQRLAGHFVRAFDLTHPMRNRRSNKTFPEQEFHTVMCGVVFEIPGKWRRENGIRLLRGCPFFGSFLWANKEMNSNYVSLASITLLKLSRCLMLHISPLE